MSGEQLTESPAELLVDVKWTRWIEKRPLFLFFVWINWVYLNYSILQLDWKTMSQVHFGYCRFFTFWATVNTKPLFFVFSGHVASSQVTLLHLSIFHNQQFFSSIFFLWIFLSRSTASLHPCVWQTARRQPPGTDRVSHCVELWYLPLLFQRFTPSLFSPEREAGAGQAKLLGVGQAALPGGW